MEASHGHFADSFASVYDTQSADETPSSSGRPAKRPRSAKGKRERCVNACQRCKSKKIKCFAQQDTSSRLAMDELEQYMNGRLI